MALTPLSINWAMSLSFSSSSLWRDGVGIMSSKSFSGSDERKWLIDERKSRSKIEEELWNSFMPLSVRLRRPSGGKATRGDEKDLLMSIMGATADE